MSHHVLQWLERIQLQQYFTKFLEGGYDSIDKCYNLTDDALIHAGVALVGHRKRILTHLPSISNVVRRSSMDNNNIYGNAIVADMQPQKGGSPRGSPRVSYASEDLPPPSHQCSQIKRESVKGYINMSKGRDSTASSVCEGGEDIYDVPPPRPHRAQDDVEYLNIGAVEVEDLPPMLPPKKHGPRQNVDEKLGITFRPQTPPDKKKPPVPKPRVSIQKQKPIPAPRRKKSITLRGATVSETSTDDGNMDESSESNTPLNASFNEDESVYEELSESATENQSMEAHQLSFRNSANSGLESMDTSGVVSIDWGKPAGTTASELDFAIPVYESVHGEEEDEYVPPGVRPLSGGCDGADSPMSVSPNRPHVVEAVYSNTEETSIKDSIRDSRMVEMVDNDIYDRSEMSKSSEALPGLTPDSDMDESKESSRLSRSLGSLNVVSSHIQPEGRIGPIGAEVSPEEVDNFANERMTLVEQQGDEEGSETYGEMWNMKSGMKRDVSLISEASSRDSRLSQIVAPPPPNFSPPKPPINEGKRDRLPSFESMGSPPPIPTFIPPTNIPEQSAKDILDEFVHTEDFNSTPASDLLDIGSRASVISFNEPEPTFSPPPLPTSPIDLPPALPPRPCANKPSPAKISNESDSSDFDSLAVDKVGFSTMKESTKTIAHSVTPSRPAPSPPCAPPSVPARSVPQAMSSAAESDSKQLYSLVSKIPANETPKPKPPMNMQESISSDIFTNNASSPVFKTTAGFGEFPGNDEDEEIFGTLQLATSSPDRGPAPLPPPKVNPFQNFFDRQSGTYVLQGEWEDKDDDGPCSATVWESDDTLSDGGDFFDFDTPPKVDIKTLIRKSSVTIVPARKSNTTEKKGYLYKQPSATSHRSGSFKFGSTSVNVGRKSKPIGWLKRWVTFDSHYFRYFGNHKSVVSKRMIPVSTIVNVEQTTKSGEAHPYRFTLTTIDRSFCFACEDADENAQWTQIIMAAIIECHREEKENLEGGEMHNPSKQGLVKIEGVKGKRYLAVKGEKMCYYNTELDFKSGTPIHEIEMKLATVKQSNKTKLQLITPYAEYGLQFDSGDELSLWKQVLEEAIAEGLGDDSVLNEVFEVHSNRLCADCGAPDPHWAAINLGITICKNCAGIHRQMSIPISKVKSLRMDTNVWTPTLIQLMKMIGNDNANNFWEWNASEEDKIDSDADMPSRQHFILSKYKNRRFCRFHPLQKDQVALDEALCKCVQYGNVIETMQLLFSGANIYTTSSTYSHNDATPLHLAKEAKQVVQVEFLIQNGAENPIPVHSPHSESSVDSFMRRQVSVISKKGFLYKTGSNQRSDFLKRWVILEHGTLTYFESDKSQTAKDCIEKREMISVSKTQDDRFEHAFEVSTTKQNGRIYLFASESKAERDSWVCAIAQNIVDLSTHDFNIENCDFERGGRVYLRVGATGHYNQLWIHLNGRKLYIYNKENEDFDQFDLRMRKSVTMLTSSENCPNAFENGHPFVIDLPDQALYIQSDMRKETLSWFQAISMATIGGGDSVAEQQLTADGVPVIVEKCINFLSSHAMQVEGIYRLAGQHIRIAKLLELFKEDARNVHLLVEEYQVHDVANTLKRFFRTLKEPLLTKELRSEWIEKSKVTELATRLEWYKYLLGRLPTVNYSTLKKMITHLHRVADECDVNKMNVTNLCSIFGPVFMTVDESDMSTGFGDTPHEISVIKDLMENDRFLFEIKDKEIDKENKIEEAIKKIMHLNNAAKRLSQLSHHEMSDISWNIGIYVDNLYSDPINIKVSSGMTVADLYKEEKIIERLRGTYDHGLHEVICQGELERPIHFSEKVLDVVQRWGTWPEEYGKNNYLCLKNNEIYQSIKLVFDPSNSLFGEMRFSEKKGFKKFCFEFSQLKLSYQKDPKSVSHIGSWNIEDLTVYKGSQKKRGAPTEWSLTFIKNGNPVLKNKETPFFGHCISLNNKEELYRWLAAMIHAQHPSGLEDPTVKPMEMASASVFPAQPPAQGSPNLSSRGHRTSTKNFLSRLKNTNR